MERKALLASIFITLGTVAFLSGYLLTLGGEPDAQSGSLIQRFNSGNNPGPLEATVPKALPLSSRKFVSFVSLGSGNIVAIDKNGDIVEIDTDNIREKTLANLGQGGISEALLSPAGDSIIYSYYDAGNNKKQVYFNFKRGESTQIAGLRSAAFSPHGDQAAYLVNNDSGGELLISKGVNIIKRALKTRLGAAVVAWPRDDFVSVISYNKDGYGDLLILKDTGVLNKILSYQYDLSVEWSPLGERVVFSAKDDTGSELLFYKDVMNNGAAVSLDVNSNASKCAWLNEEEVICGVKNQAQFRDEFYKINTADGSKTSVSTPSINLLTKEITLSRSGGTIYVLNEIDSNLYALRTRQ